MLSFRHAVIVVIRNRYGKGNGPEVLSNIESGKLPQMSAIDYWIGRVIARFDYRE